MDAVKTQLLWIQEQLGGLSASQKMLTASLVAIMIMTILWWTRYAGTAEMEPVLDQAIPAADLGRIKAMLESKNIPTSIVGDRVLVPADRKMEAFVTLAYTDALPSDSSGAWDDMFKQMSPWDSQSKTNSIQLHFREQMLSQAIQTFIPGVAKANVMINAVNERRVGGNIEPSAAVQISTRNGHDVKPKRLLDAAASTVASAVSGLSKSRVNVVIDGVPYHTQDADGGVGSDLYDRTQELEKVNTEKILGILPPGTLATVSVDVEMISSEVRNDTIDPTKTITKEKVIETTNEETQQAQQQSSEPGALPNTGLVIGGSAAPAGPSNSVEKSRTENEVLASRSSELIHKPAGKATVVSAAVRLPRSMFVMKYKSANPTNNKEPDDAALQPMVDAEVGKTRGIVQKSLMIADEKKIEVDMYWDNGLPMLASTVSGGETSAASGLSAMVGGHMKEVILGVLAVVSLFMVSSMVRKGPMPVPAMVEASPREAQHLATAEAVAGIVGGDGNATLDGMELDEESVKAQQMVEQVSTMVKENPDAAANLVKRWLNRS